jgi:hypothetical protein
MSDRPSLGLHAVGALCAWWLLPQGFLPDHVRFWVNTVFPWALGLLSLGGLWAGPRGRAVTAGLPGFWVAMAATWLIASPRTGGWPALLLGLVGLLLGLRARRLQGKHGWPWLAPAGALCAWAQRAPEPSTHPLGETEPLALVGEPELKVTVGSLRLDIDPRLTFRSRSPDRGWVLFAPQGPGQEHGTLRGGRDADGVLHLEAVTRLEEPVWSHLNTYTTLWISGHQRLQLAFSPCPEVPVEVMPFDYPAGRPVRAAYLGEDGVFRVVEASRGEKGPFRELASGPLERTEPLGITLLDGGEPVVTVTLLDWAAQASTEPSPTAGWGLPQNALEFLRADQDPGSPAVLFVTLAATSVGRGFDSVGHAAGTYRNRVRLGR